MQLRPFTPWRAFSFLLFSLCFFGIVACGGGGGGSDAPPSPPPPAASTAPVNYSVTSSVSEINESNEGNFNFTIIAQADDVGANYSYTIADEFGSSVTGGGQISAREQAVTGINLSGLNAGSISISVTLSNSAGAVGEPATLTLTKTTAATETTISGTITFDFVPNRAIIGGLAYSLTEARPARGVEVLLLDAGDSVLDSTVTNASGSYSFSVDPDVDVRIRVNARLLSSGGPTWDFSVRDNTQNNALYAIQGGLASSGSGNSVRNLHAASGWTGSEYTEARSAAPFAILDTVYESIQMVLTAAPAINFPSAQLRWSVNNTRARGEWTEGDIGTSFYDTASGSIYLVGAADSDTDEYDRHVIAHEWCHYFDHRISRSDNIGGSHGPSDRLDTRVAYGEGFCNAFAAMALNDPVYKDTSGDDQNSEFRMNFENNTVSNPGWYNEASVAAIVYDIYDANNDGVDIVSEGFEEIYGAVSSAAYKTSDAFASIHLLLHHLKQQFASSNPSVNSGIDALASGQNIRVNDGFGSGETNDAGDPRLLPIYKNLSVGGGPVEVCSINTFGTFNKLGNMAYLVFSTPTNRLYSFNVSRTSGASNSDPDFALYRNGALIAVSRSSNANLESASGNLAVDTYLMEVYDAANRPDDTDDGTGRSVCFNVQID